MKLSKALPAVLLGLCGSVLWPRTPDVVLVTLDTFRADRLAAWGAPASPAPALNGLASRGTAFTACTAPAPLTLPSHGTLLTGAFPSRTGLHDNGTGTLAPGVRTLAEVLSKAGWRAEAVVASAVLEGRFGLNRGFSVYDDAVGPARARSATEVTDRALSLLRQRGEKPLFLWVHYFDTHEPYSSPEAYAARFPGKPYDAAAAYVDAEVARLLGALPPETLVVVASDHGEALGDHGEPTHGVLLFEPTLRTVLLFAGPGVPQGRRDGRPCSLADVPPSLLGRLGLPVPSGAFPDGVDLFGAAPPSRTLPLESWLPFDAFRWSPLLGATDGRYKWVRSQKADRLFDLQGDPGETRDLSAHPPAEALRLKAALPAFPQRAPEVAVSESLRGLGYAPVPAEGFPPRGLPDPHERTNILRETGRARLLRETGDLKGALQILAPLVQQDRENPSLAFEYGETLRRAGRGDEALAALDRAIALAPRMAEAYTAKGHILALRERIPEAVAAYEKALRLSPRLVGALDALAAAYLDLNEPEKAFPLLERAFSEGFADEETYLLQGRVHLIQGKEEAARADFQAALRQSRDPAATLKREGDIYLMRNRPEEAVRIYREVLSRYPAFAPAALTLGAVFLQADRPQEALEAFRRALKADLDPAERARVEQMVRDLESALGPGAPPSP
ncbi:MAG: sulfatase-like hydrolase/transferase [Acidobacteriota bacterium]